MSSARDVAFAARDDAASQDAVLTDPAPRDGWPCAARLNVGLQQSSYTSPLPSPDDLDRYVAHLPDAAERLLSVGEREQAHRHQIESRLATMDERALPLFYSGQRFAHAVSLLLGLAYLGVMVLAIDQGYPLVGVGGATFGVAAMIWAIRRDPSDAGRSSDRELRASWSDRELSEAYADAMGESSSDGGAER